MAIVSVTDASAQIVAQVPRLPGESRPLRALSGTVLAEPILMERDQPPFDRVTMDGIAMMSHSTVRRLKVTGTQAAGAAPLQLMAADTCIEVMTGAELPIHADCVIPVEQLRRDNDHVILLDDVTPRVKLNVHQRGSDARQGQVILQPGTHLTATDIAVIATAGYAHAQAQAAPRIALISTGNELVEPGEPIATWQVRRSNTYALHAALTSRGFTSLTDAHITDDLSALRERLTALLVANEVLVLSGGVSMGKFDYVPQVLNELGVQCVFHKIEQRPGKPMWFGVREDGKAVFALPGNPVSTLICLHRYVIPGLLAMMGAQPKTETIALAADAKSHPQLTAFVPVKLTTDAHGLTRADPCPTRGSGDFISLLGTDGFVELPPGATAPARSAVPLYRWRP
jgi:molybdopterin molybdotransferase